MKHLACIKCVYLTVFSCLLALMLLTGTASSASAAHATTRTPGKTATSQVLPPQGPRLVRQWEYRTVYVLRLVPITTYVWRRVPVTTRVCVYRYGYYNQC